eukprot:c26695_g1_i1 orf=353-1477(-)
MAGQGLAPAGEDGHEGYIGEKEMVPSHGLSGRKRRRRGRKRKEKKEDADVVTVDCVNAMSFKKKSRLLACRAVAIPLAVANEGKEMEWARRDASGGRGASPMPIAQIQYRGKRKSELGAKNFGSFSSPSALLPAKRKLTDVVPTHLGQSSFLGKMRSKLMGGQFRMLNEKLYTCSGEDALLIFKDDPAAFQLYHAGYQEQMSRWPCQPVEVIAQWLQEHSPDLVVADFGCGDGRLARSVKNKVFSLDLVALDPFIIACNMANTPLGTSSVDVAVFCLSLMGTDYPRFLKEAYRVLKPSGLLLIAEVRSRFDPENGGADPQHFIQALNAIGFSMVSKDFSNKMFAIFQFKRKKCKSLGMNAIKWPILKPCIYKRR